MSVTAKISQSVHQVRQECSLEIELRSTKGLQPGDTVEVQLPHSWMLVTGPSYTRQLQAVDPIAEHYICTARPGSSGMAGT